MEEQSDTPRQTPLVELLLAVPEDARLIYEHSPTESQSIPVGPMCRQAAMELATATRERDEARAALRMIADGDLYNADGMRTIARKFCGVGELERTGYIPAGSADEREARAEVERLRKTLDEIATYWNGSHRPAETLDAAEWTRGVAEEALAATESKL